MWLVRQNFLMAFHEARMAPTSPCPALAAAGIPYSTTTSITESWSPQLIRPRLQLPLSSYIREAPIAEHKVWRGMVCDPGRQPSILGNLLIAMEGKIFSERQGRHAGRWIGGQWSLASATFSRLIRTEFCIPLGNGRQFTMAHFF